MQDFHGLGANWSRDLKADVQDMVARMLNGISATIAAQKDGAAVSDQHRVLNFQGAGVTVNDDPAARRANVFIPGAPTSIAPFTAGSNVTARARSLWNSGTSSNDAPPANWGTSGFDDSSWTAATAPASGPNPIPGSTSIWYHSTTDPAVGVAALFRQHATVPPGTITSASLTILADSTAPAIYINGNLLGNQPFYAWGGTLVPFVFTIPSSWLVTGDNVIAVWVVNDSGDAVGQVNYLLTVNIGTGTIFGFRKIRGTGNKTTTSATFVVVDGANLPVTVSLAVGDQIECTFSAQGYGGLVNVDVQVAQPTMGTTRLNSTATHGAALFASASSQVISFTTEFTVAEAGSHTFQPVFSSGSGTSTFSNASSGADDTAIYFSVKKVG